MCCAFLVLVFLGPRFFNFMWWLVQPARYNITFNTFFFPFLGVLFLPWTTLMYVVIYPGGVTGWDFLWLGIAFMADIASYSGGGYSQREKVPGYSSGSGGTATKAGPAVAVSAPVAGAAAVAAGAAVVKSQEPVTPTPPPAAPAAAAMAAPEPAPMEGPTEAAAAANLQQVEANVASPDLSNMREKVDYIEGIGPSYLAKLTQAGIMTVLDLLKAGGTRKGRADLVAKTGIPADNILTWVNHADLFRIKGVGKQFAELLEAAGVDSVPELAQRNPVNLFNRITQLNTEKKLVGRAPRQDEVTAWVDHAKTLPKVVQY